MTNKRGEYKLGPSRIFTEPGVHLLGHPCIIYCVLWPCVSVRVYLPPSERAGGRTGAWASIAVAVGRSEPGRRRFHCTWSPHLTPAAPVVRPVPDAPYSTLSLFGPMRLDSKKTSETGNSFRRGSKKRGKMCRQSARREGWRVLICG